MSRSAAGGESRDGSLRALTSRDLFDALAERIANSRLPRDTRLTEEGLAREFNVSRTPVREALRLLEQAGLVERTRSRGYVVKVPDLLELAEIYAVRKELEDLAVRLVAARVDTPEFEELHSRAARAAADCGRGESDFHQRFVALSGNRELVRALRHTWLRSRPYARLDEAIRERAEVIDTDHAELMDLLSAGDVAAARRLMQEHLSRTGSTIEQLIAAGVSTLSFVPDSRPTTR